eukprot:300898_1
MVNYIECWAIFSVISIVTWCLFFRFLVIHARKMWWFRTVDLISKRNPPIILSFAVGGCTIHLLSRMYFVLISLLEVEGINVGFAGNSYIKDIAISVTLLWLLLLDCVLWISYFNWTKSRQLIKTQWKEHLKLIEKIHHHTTKQPWTLRYGKMLSNAKYIWMIAIAYWIFYVSALLYLTNVTENGNGSKIYDLFTLCLTLIPSLPPVFMIFFSRRLLDTLGIRYQLRDVGIMINTAFLLVVLNLLFVPFGVYRILITYVVINSATVIIGIRMVYIYGLQNYVQMEKFVQASSSVLHSNENRLDSLEEYTFSHVWNNKQLFSLFANHCCSEYSVETLLFILEFSQFREYIIDNHQELIRDLKEQKVFLETMETIKNKNLYFVSNEILKIDHTDTVTMMNCIELAKYLYHTYIDADSMIEVNISAQIKRNIVKAFNKHNLIEKTNITRSNPKIRAKVLPMVVIHSYNNQKDKTNAVDKNIRIMITDIIQSLDSAAVDLFLLLYKDSWPRFKQTDEFYSFINQTKD